MSTLKPFPDRFGMVLVFAVIFATAWLAGTMSGAQVLEGLVVITVIVVAGDALLRYTREQSKR